MRSQLSLPAGSYSKGLRRRTFIKLLVILVPLISIALGALVWERRRTSTLLQEETDKLTTLLAPNNARPSEASAPVKQLFDSLSVLPLPPSPVARVFDAEAFYPLTDFDGEESKAWLAKNSYLIRLMERALAVGTWPESRLRMHVQPCERFTAWRGALLLAGVAHGAARAGNWAQVQRYISLGLKFARRMNDPTEPYRFGAQYLLINEMQQMLYRYGSSIQCQHVVERMLQEVGPLTSAKIELSDWYRFDVAQMDSSGIRTSGGAQLSVVERMKLMADPNCYKLVLTRLYRRVLQSTPDTGDAPVDLRAMLLTCRELESDTSQLGAAYGVMLSQGTARWFLDEACSRQLTAAALAIYKFMAKYGRLPLSLDECGEFRDPYGLASLQFSVEKGGFALYSVGPNGIDDGGNRRGPGPGPLGYQQETDDLELGVPRVSGQ